MDFDLLIRGGLVVDGTGAPGRHGDLGVREGRIVDVAPHLSGSASASIDAEGLVVAPGFIDSHTHLDGQMFWDPAVSSSSWHGCTTAIMGNCGFTLSPTRNGDPEYPISLMAGVEQIPRDVIEENVPFGWKTFAEYVDALEGRAMGINAASYVGYPILRHAVMGDRAFQERATREHIESLKRELDRALQAGALGLSLNRQPGDCDDKGRPSAGVDCSFEEIIEVASVLRGHPGTVLQCVPGFAMPYQGFTAENIREQDALIEAAKAADAPLVWGPAMEVWADLFHGLVDRARGQGVEMWAAAGVIPVASMACFQIRNVFGTIDGWERLYEASGDEVVGLISDPEFRRSLKACVTDEGFTGFPLQTHDAEGNVVKGPAIPYSWAHIWRLPPPPASFDLSGPSLLEEARSRDLHPVDLLFDGAIESDLGEFLVLLPHPYDADQILAHIDNPRTVISTNDTGAHFHLLSNATTTHTLGHWVRRTKRLTLERAIHLLTGRQSEVFRLRDRGTLQPGKAADVVIFDLETVDAYTLELASDVPGGHSRFLQRSTGVRHVIVNGVPLIEDGRVTGASGGRFLRPRDMAAA
jgi:N-acyl-D-aspartate/D-glutamate deacylase